MAKSLFSIALMICASVALQNQVYGAPWSRKFPAKPKQVIIEGDILATQAVEDLIKDSQLREPNEKRKVPKKHPLKFWPAARVPYVVDSTLSNEAKKEIRAAVKEFRNKTCVRFVPKEPKDQDYVYFYRQNGCFSAIGRTGGRQVLSVGPGCESLGTVLHEMMHALGFFHEHTRPDRDKYIRINWWNIQHGKSKNFESYSHGDADTLKLAYDYDSVMHYSNKAFSYNLADTIQALKDPKKRLGTSIITGHFSPLDITAINQVYRCGFPSQPLNTNVTQSLGPPTSCKDKIDEDTCLEVLAFAPESCNSNNDIMINCKKTCNLC